MKPSQTPAADPPSIDSVASVLAALARWAFETPDATAICCYAPDAAPLGSWTYQSLARAVSAAASRLETTLAPEQSVILAAPNSFEFVVWLLAGLTAGVRVAAIHPLTPAFEQERIASALQARAVISAEPLDSLTHFSLKLTEGVASDPHHRRAQGSIILQSSGTGGSPRLARRTEASLDADARGLAAAAHLRPDDRVLIAVPLSHSYGVDLLCASLLAGASLHVLDTFDLLALSRLLQRGVPTFFPGVPFMFEALARSSTPVSVTSLRLALSAGSALPDPVRHDIHHKCGLRVGQLYGATELGTVALSIPDAPDFDPRSVGTPVTGASVRIVAPGSPETTLPIAAEGELIVKVPSMLAEYIDGPFSSIDGHFLTGDLGRIDDLGRIYVTGRLKHLIDVGGLKVNPLEVEETFSQHRGIAECALVPILLSDTIVRLRLLFVPRAGASPDPTELRAFARKRLAPHKLPRVFDAVASLPRSPTGKLLRTQLNQL